MLLNYGDAIEDIFHLSLVLYPDNGGDYIVLSNHKVIMDKADYRFMRALFDGRRFEEFRHRIKFYFTQCNQP